MLYGSTCRRIMFTMCICELVKNLKVIGGKVRKTKDEEETRRYCVGFWERLNKFLEEECQDVGDKISGLELAWDNLASNRQYLKECGEVHDLFHILFLTCARVILSMEWENLPSDDPARESFQACLVKCEPKMAEYQHKEISFLNDLIKNKWSEPTLIKIMIGEEDLDETEASAYLHSLPSDILRLRLSLLMEGKCDEYALNLSTWLVRLKVFQQDVDIIQKHLVLLLKHGNKDQFHKKCAKVPCHVALEIINCVKNQQEYKDDALTLAQTFLGQDLFRPSYYCCTKSLIKVWAQLQYEKDGNHDAFVQSVVKMSKLAKNSLQMTFFAEILFDLWDDEFLEICTEFLVQACKADAVQFLFYKGGGAEFNPNGLRISLIHICHLLSGMYRQHKRLRQLLTLTAFSLDPSEELFKFVELIHNVLNKNMESDADTDESASTIITANSGEEKDGSGAQSKCTKGEGEGEGSKSESTEVSDKNDSKDPADNVKKDEVTPMQTDQNNQPENKSQTTEGVESVGSESVIPKDGETLDKSKDSVTVNGNDSLCKENSGEGGDVSPNNDPDEELERLPMCKKHGCCKQKPEKLGDSVEGEKTAVLDGLVVKPTESTCECDNNKIDKGIGKSFVEDNVVDNVAEMNGTVDSSNNGNSAPRAGDVIEKTASQTSESMETQSPMKTTDPVCGDAVCGENGNESILKTDADSMESIEDTCTVFQRSENDEMRDASDDLNNVGEEMKKAGDETNQEMTVVSEEVKDVREEMKDVAEEVKDVREEMKDVTEEVKDVRKEMKDVCVEMRDISDSVELRDISVEMRDISVEVKDVSAEIKQDADSASEIISSEAVVAPCEGTNSSKSFSASFEQWLEQNKNDRIETPGEQTPASVSEMTTESSATYDNDETMESSTSNGNNADDLPGCSSATEIESVKDGEETTKRRVHRRPKRYETDEDGLRSKNPISSRTRGRDKRSKDSDDEDESSDSEKCGRGRRRKVVKYEEYCTDESESSTADSGEETEIEEDIHGVAVPGVNKKLLCDLLCICDRLRDETLNPNLPWEQLRDRCLNMFQGGGFKQEVPEVKKEDVQPQVPVQIVDPSAVAENTESSAEAVSQLSPVKVEILEDKIATVVTTDVVSSTAVSDVPVCTAAETEVLATIPSVVSSMKPEQGKPQPKPRKTKSNVGGGKNARKMLPSGRELGTVDIDHCTGCVPFGMSQELKIIKDMKDKVLTGEEVVHPRAKVTAVGSGSKKPETGKQSVNDSLMVNRTMSAFQKVESTARPRPKILLNKKSPSVRSAAVEPSQAKPSQPMQYRPLVDEFPLPVQAPPFNPCIATPMVSTAVGLGGDVRMDTSAAAMTPASFGQHVVTMASAVLQNPTATAPSVCQTVTSAPNSNGAIASVYETSQNVAYASETLNQITDPQYVAVQDQHGQPQFVLLKSPAGQTVTYTASGGKIYKIWNSKNYSRFNLGQGQRIVGIRPLVRTPSPEVTEISPAGQMLQTVPAVSSVTVNIAQSQNVVIETPSSPSMTMPVASVAKTVPLVAPSQSMSLSQIQPVNIATSQGVAVGPGTNTFPYYQSVNVRHNQPVISKQTQQQPNVSVLSSQVSGAPTTPDRSGTVPTSAGQNPGIAYAGSYEIQAGTSESDILNHIIKRATASKVVQRTSTPNGRQISQTTQNSLGMTGKPPTVKDMLQSQQSALLSQQSKGQFSDADARIRHMLMNTGVQSAKPDQKVVNHSTANQVAYRTNSLLQAAQMVGIRPNKASGQTSTSVSVPRGPNTASVQVQQVSMVKNVPPNQRLMRQALQNQQLSATVSHQRTRVTGGTRAMLDNRASQLSAQQKNSEVIVLSDSDSDSDYRRKNDDRRTYSKKDREPVLSVLAKTLGNKPPESSSHTHNPSRQQAGVSSSYTQQQMATLVANSRTLLDQVVRGSGSTQVEHPNTMNTSVVTGQMGSQKKKSVDNKAQQNVRVNELMSQQQQQVSFAVDGQSTSQWQNSMLNRIEGASAPVSGVLTQTHKSVQVVNPAQTMSVPGGVSLQNVDNNLGPKTLNRPASPVPQGQSVYLGQNDSNSPRIIVVNESPLAIGQKVSLPIPVASLLQN